MRTIVDIGEDDLSALDQLAKRERLSRAALVRQAVADLLARKRQLDAADAFGLWRSEPVDGLEYRLQFRSEW
ncbi:CopG family transcriptional regulator [Agrobacterium sp. ES01]|uniref:ribbon-helix-helix domain-containing protein n=1 Tax=Agrobacterium sp. ES01 TaxID=3420714 RepID=UPI003D0CAB33